MLTIYKFPIEVTDFTDIEIPATAKILTVQIQDGNPYVWVLLDPDQPTIKRYFRLAGTGHSINGLQYTLDYIGTFQMHSGDLVFHLFERTET